MLALQGPLRGFVLRRLLSIPPVVLAAVTLSFLMIHLVPGDPVQVMLGAGGVLPTPEQEAALRHELGLDKSLPAQYVGYLLGALHGDFGNSVTTGEPVSQVIASAAPASVALTALALAMALVFGIGIALVAGLIRSAPLRTVVDAVPVLAMSMPAYWVAILLIQIFSFQLGAFPASGDDGFASLVLPAVTMALPATGVLAQVLGNGLRAAAGESYVVTARAKGAGPARVQLRHTLRNASIPAITLTGNAIGNLLAASVVAETVFGRQGLGRLTVTAITAHDFPVLQGMVVVLAVLYVLVNLVVDLLYARIDPRVTAARRRN